MRYSILIFIFFISSTLILTSSEKNSTNTQQNILSHTLQRTYAIHPHQQHNNTPTIEKFIQITQQSHNTNQVPLTNSTNNNGQTITFSQQSEEEAEVATVIDLLELTQTTQESFTDTNSSNLTEEE